MIVEKAVYSILKADAGVEAELADRIRPVTAPPGTAYPLAVYQTIADATEQHLHGSSAHARATVQVTVWAEEYSEAKEAAEAVRLAMDHYEGLAGGVTVLSCLLENMTDVGGIPDDGSAAPEYGVALDWSIRYAQATT